MTTANLEKFNRLIDRLEMKVKLSATPIKGFVVGLSGTDSILTFILLNEVAKRMDFTVEGIHFVEDIKKLTSFQKIGTAQWLQRIYPKSEVRVVELEMGNVDQYRWAYLNYVAVTNGLWVVSTMTATEKALGTYSIMNKSASIAPLQSVYKSEVLSLCMSYNVPTDQINLSYLPDCACGRDEFAAEHINEIDAFIRNDLDIFSRLEDVKAVAKYVREVKNENDFKNRTPYNV